MSVNRRLDVYKVFQSSDGMLSVHENKGVAATYTNMDRSQSVTLSENKQLAETCLQYNFVYMKFKIAYSLRIHTDVVKVFIKSKEAKNIK